jgi:transcriptional regulator with XRE-family HTH domain
MPASSRKSCLAVLRHIAQLTQKELAQLVDCAPVTVQSVELGKLRLSERLAQRIALQTGVSVEWLLADDYIVPPSCPREPEKVYTKRHYDMTRAEIADPRTDPVDLAMAEGVLINACHKLAGGLLRAYQKGQITFYNYKLKEFLEDFGAEFAPPKDLVWPQNLEAMMRRLHRLLAEAAKSKARHPRRKESKG